MELKLTAVLDCKAKLFIAPQFVRNHAEATRAFAASVNNKETYFNQYPADYSLWELGTYDDETGNLTSLKVHVKIVDAAALINKDSADDNTETNNMRHDELSRRARAFGGQ